MLVLNFELHLVYAPLVSSNSSNSSNWTNISSFRQKLEWRLAVVTELVVSGAQCTVCKISLSFRFRISLSDMTNYKSADF